MRVYILDPAALTTSSQALCVFLAIWRRGGGTRYNKALLATQSIKARARQEGRASLYDW